MRATEEERENRLLYEGGHSSVQIHTVVEEREERGQSKERGEMSKRRILLMENKNETVA